MGKAIVFGPLRRMGASSCQPEWYRNMFISGVLLGAGDVFLLIELRKNENMEKI